MCCCAVVTCVSCVLCVSVFCVFCCPLSLLFSCPVVLLSRCSLSVLLFSRSQFLSSCLQSVKAGKSGCLSVCSAAQLLSLLSGCDVFVFLCFCFSDGLMVLWLPVFQCFPLAFQPDNHALHRSSVQTSPHPCGHLLSQPVSHVWGLPWPGGEPSQPSRQTANEPDDHRGARCCRGGIANYAAVP